jgi:hypothetical protein
MTTTPQLSRDRCFLHPGREAAARCMGCGQAFCRECVSEHDLRMLCATCLRAETAASKARVRRSLRVPVAPFHLAAGLIILWFTLYLVGRILAGIPSDFHDGKLWQEIRAATE